MASITSLIKKYIKAPFGSTSGQVPVNDIPKTTPDALNGMTWQYGIPTITTKPIASGGIPPRAGDIAGVFNVLSNELYNLKLGISSQEYDSTVSSQYGGYPKGAVVLYPNGNSIAKQLYISLVDNNTNAPTVATKWKAIIPTPPTFQSFLPDWTKPQGRSPNIFYTAVQNGWVQVAGETIGDKIRVSINDYLVAGTSARGGGDATEFGCLVPVKIGDKYIASLYDSARDKITQYNFIPLIGQ